MQVWWMTHCSSTSRALQTEVQYVLVLETSTADAGLFASPTDSECLLPPIDLKFSPCEPSSPHLQNKNLTGLTNSH